MPIHPTTQADLPGLRAILKTIELFPAEMLTEMVAPFLDDPESGELWFTAERDGRAVGFCYCRPEALTDGTYNLLAIGVSSELQGAGIGRQLMHYCEAQLRAAGHRILIVDTSGSDDFALTRGFYTKLGYAKEAVIRDFWAEGDDKVTFWKKL